MGRLIFILFLISTGVSNAGNFYVNTESGAEGNDGLSKSEPLKDIVSLASIEFHGGDTIFFAAGQLFIGSLVIENINASKEDPLVITSYGSEDGSEQATIDGGGKEAGLSVINCSGIVIDNISVIANGGHDVVPSKGLKPMRCGILVLANMEGLYHDLTIRNVNVSDVFYPNPGTQRGAADVKTANGTQPYGWGIRVISSNKESVLKGVSILNSTIYDVGHTGIKFTSMRNSGEHSIQNVLVEGNKVGHSGGPGIQMSGVKNAKVALNSVESSGSTSDSRKWGRGSGLWTWGSEDVVIEHNSFTNANGPADSAGAHIDFNCRNIVIQYNFSANNAGGFCEILGNNYNCCYRYNISVNDGHRIKGKNGAFQEGKIFWLSGYQGKGKKRAGPYNSYVYNNTIYVSKEVLAKIAIAKVSEGVLVVNNIFHIEGDSKAVLGDQYVKAEEAEIGATIPNVVFTNNIFRYSENWSRDILIQPENSAIGDVGFVDAGSNKLDAYRTRNENMVVDQGIYIERIPGDELGLSIGLRVDKDILGNPIIGRPDMGAIENIVEN